MPTGPVVVLSNFLGGGIPPTPQKRKKKIAQPIGLYPSENIPTGRVHGRFTTSKNIVIILS